MARLNITELNERIPGLWTHEGDSGQRISPELQLPRSVLVSLLWENEFYQKGVEIAGRIGELVLQLEAEHVASLAVEAPPVVDEPSLGGSG
jgi:hypothetical protein